jgi:pyrrolidone-carboxylate peptidase
MQPAIESARIHFVVTGFTPFCDIRENPSRILVETLSSLFPSLAVYRIVDTSAEAVDRFLPELYGELERQPRPLTVVILHFGVDATSRTFRLERGAKNEASFSCADNAGWRPYRRKIDNRRPLDSYLEDRFPFPLETLVRELRADPVQISAYGGTFVSNYTYYRSLQYAHQISTSALKIYPLYVHIPPFVSISKEQQIIFSLQLAERISSLLIDIDE